MCGIISSCCASAACYACTSTCGATRSATVTRVIYAVMLLITAIIAWILLNPKVSSDLSKMDNYVGHICKNSEKDCDRRWGELGVYRILSASALFHTLMALILIGVKSSRDGRSIIQKGLWPIKLLLLAALATGAFFVPNSFFMGLGWLALGCAFLFILVQMILLVDFAYSWNESWLRHVEEGSSCYKWSLIVCCFGTFALALIISICCFVFYTKHDACSLSKAALSINMILSVIIAIMAVHPRIQEAQPSSGLLQAGVVSFYSTFLIWSAVSNVKEPCGMGTEPAAATTIVGAILTFLAVTYSSLRTSSASQLGKLGLSNQPENEGLILHDSGSETDGSDGDDESDGVKYSWTFFHLTFAMAAFYLMMIITDWANIRDGTATTSKVGNGKASVWVQIVSSWVVVLMYIWTMVAPICLPNRDFS